MRRARLNIAKLAGLDGVSCEALDGYVALARGGGSVDDLLAYVAAHGLPFTRDEAEATVAGVADANRRLRPFRDLLGR